MGRLIVSERTMPLLRAKRSLRAAVFAALLLPGAALVPTASAAAPPVYKNPHASVASRVKDLMARMTLDDKIGQMTEGERGAATPAQSAAARLGSILSGGGSTPTPNTPAGW